jgi:hypothetical protein
MAGCHLVLVPKYYEESVIDSKLAVDGSIGEYWDMLVAKGSSQKGGVDLVEAFPTVTRALEIHGRDTHVW